MAQRILFVCTGNQCRSPMAEKIMERMIKREGITDIEVSSAGTAASGGEPASAMTREVGKMMGLDLSEHHATPISEELVRAVDLILVMEDIHRAFIYSICEDAIDKVKLLKSYSANPIPDEQIIDPTGLPPYAYRSCFAEILEAIEGLIRQLKREAE